MTEQIQLSKFCTKCGLEKFVGEFSPNGKAGVKRDSICKECRRIMAAERYRANPEKCRSIAISSYHKNGDVRRSAMKRRADELKDKVFMAYGGYKCACCGETKKPFLTIDHIDGGGTKHRKEMKGGGCFTYRWIVKNGFPAGFQVLCFNCNSGRAQNGGVCPHKDEKFL